MKKYLSIYLIVLIVASCVPGSEQIDRNKELEDFLKSPLISSRIPSFAIFSDRLSRISTILS